jgi:hypothetical protein
MYLQSANKYFELFATHSYQGSGTMYIANIITAKKNSHSAQCNRSQGQVSNRSRLVFAEEAHFSCSKFSIFLTTHPPLNAYVICEGSLSTWTEPEALHE